MIILLVGLGGGLGAMTRFALDTWITTRFPDSISVGTRIVNITGSLFLGLLTGWALGHGGSSDALAVLGTGFLGGYTTFSTASVEAVRLARSGRGLRTLFNAVQMLVLALGAAALGLWLTGG